MDQRVDLEVNQKLDQMSSRRQGRGHFTFQERNAGSQLLCPVAVLALCVQIVFAQSLS